MPTSGAAPSQTGPLARTLTEPLDRLSGVRDRRLHDCRRTAVTWMAGAGFPPHVADRLLNHVEGAIRGVAAVYQRGEFLPERKAALEAWAGHVVACAEREPAEEKRASPSATGAAP